MWQRVSSLKTALALAEQLKASGKANLFRGQTRTWPMLSSFVRKDPRQQQAAIERFCLFHRWMQSIPALEKIAQDEDKVLAVGQHYGLATNLVDFSTEPKVAAFFAAHDPPPPSDEEDVSCIIYLDYNELKELCESVKIVRPDMPEPRLITLDIPELWRIQSQRGVFLDYPFDIGFERHTFGFDRIVFPTERDPSILASLIPLQNIYPTQKNDLEILLDQFFMLEKLSNGTNALYEIAQEGNIIIQHQDPVPDGIEAECFGNAGLPPHESWQPSRLADWLRPPSEDWRPISAAPSASIRYPGAGNSRENIKILQKTTLELLTRDQGLRSGPIKWVFSGLPTDSPRTVRAMELVWDGLRRWPYDTNEIAQALATTIEYGELVAQNPNACIYTELAKTLATQCLGEVLEVEIGNEDGSYTRGYANKELLRQAVRDDFLAFVNDRWRPQIKDIRHILQIASNPRRALVFDRLRLLFSTQIVPTQVVLRDESSGKARLYNPARATSFGLP